MISYPNVYKLIYQYICYLYPTLFNDINLITGVNFGGIPLSSYISNERNISQIYVRDTLKTYGTQKQIEGDYTLNKDLLIIEDVITTGQSITNLIQIINNTSNIIVKKVLCIISRQNIQEMTYYYLFTINEIRDYLYNFDNIIYFNNQLSNYIYKLALIKETNIILSCDFTRCEDILNIIDKIGKYIIGVKLHTDILEDFNLIFIEKLLELKHKYNLIIIEDRKYADISNIVLKQINNVYKIHKWADIITVHSLVGDSLIKSIKNEYPNIELILITEMTSKNNLIDDNYIKNSINNAIINNVCGIVSQDKVYKYMNNYDILTFSPGVNLKKYSDNYDQIYNNLTKQCGLFLIIGRGIYESENIIESCQEYMRNGWNHFKKY